MYGKGNLGYAIEIAVAMQNSANTLQAVIHEHERVVTVTTAFAGPGCTLE